MCWCMHVMEWIYLWNENELWARFYPSLCVFYVWLYYITTVVLMIDDRSYIDGPKLFQIYGRQIINTFNLEWQYLRINIFHSEFLSIFVKFWVNVLILLPPCSVPNLCMLYACLCNTRSQITTPMSCPWKLRNILRFVIIDLWWLINVSKHSVFFLSF